jgi:hypothetical protein
MILQRLQITYDLIRTYQRLQSSKGAKKKELDKIQTRLKKSMKRILNQQPKLLTSMRNSVTLCHNIMKDRANHVQAIEYSRQKVCYDNMNEFQDAVIDTQGQEEYQEFLQNIKSQIFKDEFIENKMENTKNNRISANNRLEEYIAVWNDLLLQLRSNAQLESNRINVKGWHKLIKKRQISLEKDNQCNQTNQARGMEKSKELVYAHRSVWSYSTYDKPKVSKWSHCQ